MDIERAQRFLQNPDARLPLVCTLGIGLVVGLIAGFFVARSPENTYLLRQIREAVDSRPHEDWDGDVLREELKDDVYRAVVQALIDWEKTGQKTPGY